jgi:phosphoglycolate phosphatase-like HAD superfamily hydrolase
LNRRDASLPAVFIGDSKYDYECAREANIDFIFVYKYSEFIGWQDYFSDKRVTIISDLRELI